MALLKDLLNKSDTMAAELAEEMSLHIQEKAEALEDAGLSPAEALAEARRAFGNQGLLQEQSAAVWQKKFISPLLFDLKAASGQLKRFPALTIAAILIVAIGIGANTTIFSVLYFVSLKRLPVDDPKSLVFLTLAGPRINFKGINLTPRLYSELKAEQHAFTGLAGSITDSVIVRDQGPDSLAIPASYVSENYFTLLGVGPLLGRTFVDGDSELIHDKQAPWPVILDYRFWKDHFRGSDSVLGQKLKIYDRNGVIVGVLPAAFDGLVPGAPPRLYLPSGFLFDEEGDAQAPPLKGKAAPVVRVVGRLKHGVGIASANESLSAFNNSKLAVEFAPYLKTQPYLDGATIRAVTAAHGIRMLDEYRSLLLLLQGLMVLALLLCCANLTALQISLAYERWHEFALRIALGANRFHLTRQCLCEAFFLASSGALLSLPIPILGSHVLPRYLTRAGSASSPVVQLDWTTFAAAGSFIIIVTLLVGIAPAVFAGRIHSAAVLKARSAIGRPPYLLGRVLVVFQIALAFVLMTASSFFVMTNHRLRADEFGFHPEHVVEVSAQFQWLPFSDVEVMALYRKMLHHLSAEKDIQAASLTWVTPLTGDAFEMKVRPGFQPPRVVAFNQVGPGYFGTLQIQLLEGREFADEDSDRSHCVLNRLAARMLFQGEAPIGKTIRSEPAAEFPLSCTVIGVVADAKYADVHAAPIATLYCPITAASLSKGGYQNNMVFLIRAENDQSIEAAYWDTLRTFAPTTSLVRFLPMREQVEQALGPDELLSLATTLFALIALPLCGASLLSLMGIRIKHNATDIAIRVALGASPLYVARSVLVESLTLFTSGVAIGICTLLAMTRLLRPALGMGYAPSLSSGVYAACFLGGLVICAGGLPALQAARIRPMSLLCRDS